MKKISIFKGLVVIMLSVILVASLVTKVFADDNVNVDGWDTFGNTNNEINTTGNTNNEVNTSGNTNSSWNDPGVDLTTDGNISTGENSNTNTNTGSAITSLDTENDLNENVNSLAYTGIEDNGFLSIMIVVGLIVAAYSFKKVKEYNNL